MTDHTILGGRDGGVATTLAQKSPLVLGLLRRELLHRTDMPRSPALACERSLVGLVLDSAKAREASTAFPKMCSGRREGK